MGEVKVENRGYKKVLAQFFLNRLFILIVLYLQISYEESMESSLISYTQVSLLLTSHITIVSNLLQLMNQ